MTKIPEERSNLTNFTEIPYLNSSLFEEQDIEKTLLSISDISATGKITVYGTKEQKCLIDYLFEFLDKYNFGESRLSEGGMVYKKSRGKEARNFLK